MNWKEFIAGIDRADSETSFALTAPATAKAVARFRTTFSFQLPSSLTELYEQSDGIQEKWQAQVVGSLIWPLQQVVARNIEMRTHPGFEELYMPFDHLLFFSDAGNGDLFGFRILKEQIRRNDVYVWNHENDSRSWVAPNVERFVEWWLQGKIKV
jgi:hypothetical protein